MYRRKKAQRLSEENLSMSFYNQVQSVQNTQKEEVMKNYLNALKESIIMESKKGFYSLTDHIFITASSWSSQSEQKQMGRALRDESVSVEELELYLVKGLGREFVVEIKEDTADDRRANIVSYTCDVTIQWN